MYGTKTLRVMNNKKSFITSLVFSMSVAKAQEITGINSYADLMQELEDNVVETRHPDGKIESYSIDYKGLKSKQYYNISVIYRDEKVNREVEVFTPASYGKEAQYTGLEVTTIRSGEWVAEVGCWFEKGRLIDFDGVYELQPYMIKALRKAGWTVPSDF